MVKKISIRLRQVGGPRRDDRGDGTAFKEVVTPLVQEAPRRKGF